MGAGCASGVFKQERKENHELKEVVKWIICARVNCLRGGMRGRKYDYADGAAAVGDDLCFGK